MSPNKLIEKLLKTLRAKRADSVLGDYGLNDTYVKVMNALLEQHEKYSIEFDENELLELFQLVDALEGGYRVNDDVWSFVVKLSKHPLPSSIGIALCKKDGLLTDIISNSDQHLDVYFVAAESSKYARSRLCIRLFIDEQYPADTLQRYVNLYGSASAVRILQGRTPSSPEKLAVFSTEEQAELQIPKRENDTPSKAKRKKFKKERLDEWERVAKRRKK